MDRLASAGIRWCEGCDAALGLEDGDTIADEDEGVVWCVDCGAHGPLPTSSQPIVEAAHVAVETLTYGAEDAQRSAAYRVRIAELQAELERERDRSRAMHRRAQRAEGATSPDVTWEDGYMTGWRRGRRGEGYVDPNPYLEDTGPRAVARRTPTALLGEPDATR